MASHGGPSAPAWLLSSLWSSFPLLLSRISPSLPAWDAGFAGCSFQPWRSPHGCFFPFSHPSNLLEPLGKSKHVSSRDKFLLTPNREIKHILRQMQVCLQNRKGTPQDKLARRPQPQPPAALAGRPDPLVQGEKPRHHGNL